MKKDIIGVLSLFDKNKTVGDILTSLEKEIEMITTRQTSEPELVDLGLPSGNLWMTHNMGAKTEINHGLYYYFGGLKGYSLDEIEKLKPYNLKENNDISRFNINPGKMLKPEEDIVTQTFGCNYRIPTREDFLELLDNTTSEICQNYKGSGICGRLFKSKVNCKTIFIPFSGYVYLDKFSGDDSSLWSSSICTMFGKASYCFIHLPEINGKLQVRILFMDNLALPIRGIKVKRD